MRSNGKDLERIRALGVVGIFVRRLQDMGYDPRCIHINGGYVG